MKHSFKCINVYQNKVDNNVMHHHRGLIMNINQIKSNQINLIAIGLVVKVSTVAAAAVYKLP